VTRRISLSSVILACAIAARPVAAQDSAAIVGLDAETSAQVSRIVASARSRGLPVDPILSKVRFAVVVHAPAAKIVATAEAVATRLDAARSVVAPHGAPGDIAAGEEALSFNVPKDVLKRVVQASANRSVAVPIGVLTQLVVSGVPANKAGEIVTELIKRGASPAQLVALGNDVNADVQGGARAVESADIRMRGLTPLLAPAAAAAQGPAAGLQSGDPRKKP
jgi:hypothetical protein